MVHITCDCLNIQIQLVEGKLVPYTPKEIEKRRDWQSLVQDGSFSLFGPGTQTAPGTLALHGVTAQHPSLIIESSHRSVSSWTLVQCGICCQTTHAKPSNNCNGCGGNGQQIIVNCFLERESAWIGLMKQPDTGYSTTFRVILKPDWLKRHQQSTETSPIDVLAINLPVTYVQDTIHRLKGEGRKGEAVKKIESEAYEQIRKEERERDEKIRAYKAAQILAYEQKQRAILQERDLLVRILDATNLTSVVPSNKDSDVGTNIASERKVENAEMDVLGHGLDQVTRMPKGNECHHSLTDMSPPPEGIGDEMSMEFMFQDSQDDDSNLTLTAEDVAKLSDETIKNGQVSNSTTPHHVVPDQGTNGSAFGTSDDSNSSGDGSVSVINPYTPSSNEESGAIGGLPMISNRGRFYVRHIAQSAPVEIVRSTVDNSGSPDFFDRRHHDGSDDEKDQYPRFSLMNDGCKSFAEVYRRESMVEEEFEPTSPH